MSGARLCIKCLRLSFCRKKRARVVSDEEMENPHFINDARQTIGDRLSAAPDGIDVIDVLMSLYRDYPGRIVDARGVEVFLDTDLLETEQARAWLRAFLRADGPRRRAAYLRPEARERFRIIASIIRAAYPDEAMMWGVRPVNDNAAGENGPSAA